MVFCSRRWGRMQFTKNFNKWMVIAIVLTIGYFIFLFLAATGTVAARDCASSGVVANWFGCLTMNELGDFFAGAFAPVAFIWLVAAVLIQSQELRAQREELEQNREVMMAQAAEARKQAEYIGEQTELLKAEKVAREDAEKTRVFDAAVSRVFTAIKMYPRFLVFKSMPISNTFDISVDIKSIEDKGVMIRTICEKLESGFLEHIHFLKDKEAEFVIVYPQHFSLIFDYSNVALKLYGELPLESKIRADSLGLLEFHRGLTEIQEQADNVWKVESQDNALSKIGAFLDV